MKYKIQYTIIYRKQFNTRYVAKQIKYIICRNNLVFDKIDKMK